MLSNKLFEAPVEKNASIFPMGQILEEKCHFQHFRFPRYSTDVTFHQGYRPTGNMQERKVLV